MKIKRIKERDFIHEQGCIVNGKKCDKGKHYECWKCPFAACNISFFLMTQKEFSDCIDELRDGDYVFVIK